MGKPPDCLTALQPILLDLQHNGKHAMESVIFCRAYKDTINVHECIVDELGKFDCFVIDGNIVCACLVYSLSKTKVEFFHSSQA